MKAATHIQKRRSEGIANKQFMLDMTGMTGSEYEWTFVDAGRAFLRDLFPETETYDEFYLLHRSNPLFWKWFRVQWNHFEQDYLNFLCENEVYQDTDDWQANMLQIACDDTTHKDFYLYIKFL